LNIKYKPLLTYNNRVFYTICFFQPDSVFGKKYLAEVGMQYLIDIIDGSLLNRKTSIPIRQNN